LRGGGFPCARFPSNFTSSLQYGSRRKRFVSSLRIQIHKCHKAQRPPCSPPAVMADKELRRQRFERSHHHGSSRYCWQCQQEKETRQRSLLRRFESGADDGVFLSRRGVNNAKGWEKLEEAESGAAAVVFTRDRGWYSTRQPGGFLNPPVPSEGDAAKAEWAERVPWWDADGSKVGFVLADQDGEWDIPRDQGPSPDDDLAHWLSRGNEDVFQAWRSSHGKQGKRKVFARQISSAVAESGIEFGDVCALALKKDWNLIASTLQVSPEVARAIADAALLFEAAEEEVNCIIFLCLDGTLPLLLRQQERGPRGYESDSPTEAAPDSTLFFEIPANHYAPSKDEFRGAVPAASQFARSETGYCAHHSLSKTRKRYKAFKKSQARAARRSRMSKGVRGKEDVPTNKDTFDGYRSF
jgi:hypothetical protein